jgi:hypothetical protein
MACHDTADFEFNIGIFFDSFPDLDSGVSWTGG